VIDFAGEGARDIQTAYCQHSQFFEVLPDGPRRRAPENYALAANYLLAGNAALGAQDRACLDANMIGNAHLTRHYHAIFQHRAAGKAGLRGDHNVLADLAVVANVHQVVDFCASGYAGCVQCTAINGGVGADFDVIFDFEAADLRKLFITAGRLIAHVAEAIAAEHRARVNDDSVSEACTGIDRDVRIQITIASDDCFRADHAAGADPRALADGRALADDYSLSDCDVAGCSR